MPNERLGEELSTQSRTSDELDARALALKALNEARVPYLVAGAYAFFEYTGIFRDTKDLDVFLRERHLEKAFEALRGVGFRTELLDPVWLGKAYSGEYFVDLIFSSGNGIAVVDDHWFEHARPGTVMGIPCLLAPPEEIIWSKGFVTERERYDGADVNHIIHACGDRMDWTRLLARFERYWEVLFSHILLYRFVYPSERSKVPRWVIEEMMRRTLADEAAGDLDRAICRGNLMSKVQYQFDYQHRGFEDGRRWDERERGAEDDGGREREVPVGGGG